MWLKTTASGSKRVHCDRFLLAQLCRSEDIPNPMALCRSGKLLNLFVFFQHMYIEKIPGAFLCLKIWLVDHNY